MTSVQKTNWKSKKEYRDKFLIGKSHSVKKTKVTSEFLKKVTTQVQKEDFSMTDEVVKTENNREITEIELVIGIRRQAPKKHQEEMEFQLKHGGLIQNAL